MVGWSGAVDLVLNHILPSSFAWKLFWTRGHLVTFGKTGADLAHLPPALPSTGSIFISRMAAKAKTVVVTNTNLSTAQLASIDRMEVGPQCIYRLEQLALDFPLSMTGVYTWKVTWLTLGQGNRLTRTLSNNYASSSRDLVMRNFDTIVLGYMRCILPRTVSVYFCYLWGNAYYPPQQLRELYHAISMQIFLLRRKWLPAPMLPGTPVVMYCLALRFLHHACCVSSGVCSP